MRRRGAWQANVAKMPSIRTVADRAGVSTATVSNVLNMRRNVAPALAARVRAAVAELGYIADVGAARLRSRRSTVAGVVVPDIANPFFGCFVSILEEEARAAGYDLLIASSGGDSETEAARLRTLMTWRPAGVIVVPCDDQLATRTVARAAGVPMVVADRIPKHPDLDVVGVDNRAAAAEVTHHLVNQGHTRLLAVASSLAIRNVAERCDGFRAAADGRAETAILEVGLSVEECREALTRHLAAAPAPPAALFTLNNLATMGALEALSGLGLQVGRDIALAGFDDEEWMRVVSPPLTAVRQPTAAMARAAWGRLLARIGGDTSAPREMRLACTLEIRASSQPARPRETTRAA